MMGQQVPVLILKDGSKREKGKGAVFGNITAARAVADAVRSTLGPRGMDKMLVDSMGDVVITNDGVTILKEVDIEHPAAKMMVEVAKAQDQEVGDGTTTAVILAGELLKRSEELIGQNVHPTVITAGFRMAADRALEILDSAAEKVAVSDRETLRKLAMTSIASKSSSGSKELLSDIAVDAVRSVAETTGGRAAVDLDNILVTKKHGGAVEDSVLVQGIIVDKEAVSPAMPKRLEKASVALLDCALEIKKTEVDAKIEIRKAGQRQAFLDAEEKSLRRMADRLKEAGATAVFCQKGIDDLVQHYLAKAGIYAARRCKRSDMEKLSKATGARMVSRLEDLSKDDLGRAGLVEERKIGDDRMTFVTDCEKARAVSILLRGGTEHVVDEMERSLHDALSVVAAAVEDGRISTGGGSAAMEVALGLREFSSSVGGREQMAISAFADAMEVVPRVLAENAGLDPIDILIELRKAHKAGRRNAGVNVFTGKIVDMREENVVEPLRLGKQAIQSAAEAASMVLRIDDVIAAKSGGLPGGGKKPPMPDTGGED
ncbi:MAG: thermosome subunit [Euryarchaeota archaeon]|nr:thermosome subunit [Euryarchaeota archaeon]